MTARVFTVMAFAALCATGVAAPVRLPVDFDGPDPLWIPKPTFQSTPAQNPRLSVADGAVTLAVDEPGRSMKFELQVHPFDPEVSPYLVFRYRAENLAGGYAIWVFDGSQGGRELLNTSQLTRDGQWHTAAIDLWAAGAESPVRSLLTDVRCAQQPASISFDRIWLSGSPPPEAQLFPEEVPPEAVVQIEAESLVDLTAQPTWLQNPTASIETRHEERSVILRAREPGRGMKWSCALPQPVDLGQYKYMAVRYRARDIYPLGDYCVWLGSAPGGQPPENAMPLRLPDLVADGFWHVAVSLVPQTFTAVSVALQVQSARGEGEIEFDWFRFSQRRPLVAAVDKLGFEPGWGASRLAEGTFDTLDLAALGNASMRDHLRAQGLSSWLEPGPLTVDGIPFQVAAGARDCLHATTQDQGWAYLPLSGKASEVYLLIAARLPVERLHTGTVRQLQSIRTVERFVCELSYADGVTDEIFPVAVRGARYELQQDIGAYALTQLRDAPLAGLRLRNYMSTADLVVAAVTLNRGAALTPAPAVLGLPDPAPVTPVPAAAAGITPDQGGFVIDDGLLRLDLQTEGGIRLRSLHSRCPGGDRLSIVPGPLFELGDGQKLVTSEQVSVGSPGALAGQPAGTSLVLPLDARPAGVPISGELVISVGEGPGTRMWLNLTNAADGPLTPVVNFPLLRGVAIGSPADTWYLYTRKGGIISNQPTSQRRAYGGQHPLQVDDVFNPVLGSGLLLQTLDLENRYRFHVLSKDEAGVSLGIEYFPHEHQPGEAIVVAPTVLRAHSGDWREALRIYRDWAHSWYRPQVPRKDWFQGVFYYQQVLAWSTLRDRQTGQWRTEEVINRYRDYFGRLDYMHIFDFGQSMIYGRVGDYNHYEELGGLEQIRGEIARAQAMGVPVGLYIEGYLCDERGVWGREHVSKCDIRQKDGSPLLWPRTPTEHMMCPDCPLWRQHLADTYRRVAAELQPNGMYIDQYGFGNPWKVCYSREHGHPVAWGPIAGERRTTEAIRAAIPQQIANLTEETPNDVNSQHQDGALGYSVWEADPDLMPHRVDLFRFVFPDFKVFQLTQYEPFTEGDWDLLKFPFFNGEGYWLGGGTADSYDEEAHQFLRRALAILNDNEDAFCSADVEALVPTLRPTVYANRFAAPGKTIWTLFNAEYRSFRGEALAVPHQPGTRYVDAFTGEPIQPRVQEGRAYLPVELGARRVGCIIATR